MNTGLSKSFTKKGTGRMHDFSGIIKKCRGKNIKEEREIRRRCGAFTYTFFRKCLIYKKLQEAVKVSFGL